MPPSTQDRLTDLHKCIEACRVCENSVPSFVKPSSMFRGDGGRIAIIGQGPGRTEETSGRAFSGQAGKRLDKWLVASGRPAINPRKDLYLTSLIKCVGSNSAFETMFGNCNHFLFQQMELVRPSIIITLGREAYDHLKVSRVSYPDAICNLIDTERESLFSRFGFHFIHVVWPHPSGRNRWLNDPYNKLRLEQSFRELGERSVELL